MKLPFIYVRVGWTRAGFYPGARHWQTKLAVWRADGVERLLCAGQGWFEGEWEWREWRWP